MRMRIVGLDDGRPFEALDLLILHWRWQRELGTPHEAEAKKLLDDAIAAWKRGAEKKKVSSRALDEACDLYHAVCVLMRDRRDKIRWQNVENAAQRFGAAYQAETNRTP